MKPRFPYAWPLVVAVLGFVATGMLWRHEQEQLARRVRDNIDFSLRQMATRVEQRVGRYEQMLRGVRGLFETAGELHEDDFAAYVAEQRGGADYAGLKGLGYAPWVAAGDRARGLAGVPNGVPAPAANAVAAPIAFVVPPASPGTGRPGEDLLDDPVRRSAMQAACDSGGATLTSPVRLGDATADAPPGGFLLFMPVYARGAAPTTADERRAALRGFVFLAFRFADLMATLHGELPPDLALRVYDGPPDTPGPLLHGAAAADAVEPWAGYAARRTLEVAGRAWTVELAATPAFEHRQRGENTGLVLAGGIGLSLLSAALTWMFATGRERADAAARRITRELRESTERYRRIVETANEGIWTLDLDGRISFANPKLADMIGLRSAALIGRRGNEFLPDAPTSPLPDDTAPGQVPTQDLRLRRADGGERWVTLRSSPIVDAAGAHRGTLGMVIDITERRQSEARRALLEEQLRQSQKMEAIGTLAGGIAHDFNNILAAILGNLDLARDALGPTHPATARLSHVHEAATRARSLVQQIVAFSRRQAVGARSVQPLQPLVEETLRLLRAMLPAMVQLEPALPAAPVWVSVDATQLQQVLMNLCTNAWHALEGHGGHIHVGVETATLGRDEAQSLGLPPIGRWARLWVRDDGCGMDEATRRRVFEPFFTTKPIGQGTGLGLSVVHGIVTAHGGAIRVDSEAGRGSTFELFLPLATAPRERAEPSVPQSGEDAPPSVAAAMQMLQMPPEPDGETTQALSHVLYVDDDPVMLLTVQALLERAGHRVTAGGDPGEALARALQDHDPIDLVVTDYNMPGTSGLALARSLSSARPSLPVIVISGYVTETLSAQAEALGVRAVLQKEYMLEQLLPLVDRVLAENAATGPREDPPMPPGSVDILLDDVEPPAALPLPADAGADRPR